LPRQSSQSLQSSNPLSQSQPQLLTATATATTATTSLFADFCAESAETSSAATTGSRVVRISKRTGTKGIDGDDEHPGARDDVTDADCMDSTSAADREDDA
jgi:hypothetical protein